MGFHQKPIAVQKVAVALLSSAGFYTKEAGDPLDVLAKKFGEYSAQVMTKLGATNEDLQGLQARLDELDQKLARGGGGGDSGFDTKTIGTEFSENEDLQSFAARGGRGRVEMQVKATITSASNSGGALTSPTRDSYVPLPQRRLTVRNLLPVVNVNTGSVEYPRLVTRPTGAAPVAEGALKPESEMSLELQNAPIRTIAHWIPASRQILDDAPQLRDIIDTELLYGLKLKEEEQLLYGSGVGQNILGMVTQATPFAPIAPLGSGTNIIDKVGIAILQTALTDLEPDGVVVSTADWMAMRLLKDGEGRYLLGAPGQNVQPVLFGLPVVATPAMTVDKFLVGAFQAAGTIYDRWQARIEVSTEHADFFVRNMVAILCEERIGLAIKRTKALTYGDFGNVPD